jgi:hypothetical protein
MDWVWLVNQSDPANLVLVALIYRRLDLRLRELRSAVEKSPDGAG